MVLVRNLLDSIPHPPNTHVLKPLFLTLQSLVSRLGKMISLNLTGSSTDPET